VGCDEERDRERKSNICVLFIFCPFFLSVFGVFIFVFFNVVIIY